MRVLFFCLIFLSLFLVRFSFYKPSAGREKPSIIYYSLFVEDYLVQKNRDGSQASKCIAICQFS